MFAALKRRFGKKLSSRLQRAKGRLRKAFLKGLQFESLEARNLLAVDDVISVGRFQSVYSKLDVQNHEMSVTYTVFNQQETEVSGVSLKTTLAPGVAFKSATSAPQQTGQLLNWTLPNLKPYGSATIELIVTLPTIIPTQIENGAQAFGTVTTGAVSDAAPAATLRSTAIDPTLLESSTEADTLDPYVRAKAAQLDHDPQQIFAFLKNDIGFESYFGSLRGARGTLWSGAGNSLDEANLGVALMRASGIPARYAEGQLTTERTQELILSMFDDPLRVIGFVDEGIERADPANNNDLINETYIHHWMQIQQNGVFVDADASFANSALGVAPTTVDSTFNAVPENLQHAVVVRLNSEMTIPAIGQFTGGSSQVLTNVMDRRFTTAELVGRALTIGHFVETYSLPSTFAATTHNYAPYLRLQDETRALGDDILYRGDDFQELLTSFPLGSQILTGLFLDLQLQKPHPFGLVTTESVEKTLFDRIGFDARHNGGSVSIPPDSGAVPAISPYDITTLTISASAHSPTTVYQTAPLLLASANALNALLSQNAPIDPAQLATFEQSLNQLTLGNLSRFGATLGSRFLQYSDANAKEMGDFLLTRGYWDSPRILAVSNRLAADATTGEPIAKHEFDLLRDHPRAVVAPGQSVIASQAFMTTQTISDKIIENEIVRPFIEDGSYNGISSYEIYQIAGQAGVAILTSSNLGELDGLALSAEAKARITQAVSKGMHVATPIAMATVRGEETVAWIEIDPVSGRATVTQENGAHAATFIQKIAVEIYSKILAGAAITGQVRLMGFVAFISVRTRAESYISHPAIGNYVTRAQAIQEFTLDAAEMLRRSGIDPYIANRAILELFKHSARAINGKIADPPVGDMLYSPAIGADYGGLLTEAGSGIAAKIIHDPLFTQPYAGGELPTVFRVGVANGGAAKRMRFQLETPVPGFDAETSVDSILTPQGQIGEVGLRLIPTGALPAPGTVIPIAVRVFEEANPANFKIATFNYTVPQIHGVTLSIDPLSLSLAPNGSQIAKVTVKAVGNVSESVAFTLTPGAAVNTSGIPNTTLAVGETKTFNIQVSASAGAALGTNSKVVIEARFLPEGEAEFSSIEATLAVTVDAPGLTGLGRAANALFDLGEPVLANRVDELRRNLTDLFKSPGNALLKTQALATLDSLISLMKQKPMISYFAPDFQARRDALALANTDAQTLNALALLGDRLDAFSNAVIRLAQGNFELFLTPSSQVAQPGAPTQFEIKLRNIGTAPTTYQLALGSLPGGVSGSLSSNSVTLNPGQFATNLFVTVTPGATELFPFEFKIDVNIQGSPDLKKAVYGSMTVRKEFLSVVDVTANPLFVNSGAITQVSTRLFNVVNRPQDVLVSYLVKNANGAQVFASSAKAVTLNTQQALMQVDLESFVTTGLANGQYKIELTVTDPQENPLPGGTGEGTVFVGAPVSSTITVSPTELLQGSSTITTTLTVDSQIPLENPLHVVSQTFVSAATDVKRQGDFVYVATATGVQVFNVAGANINAPVFVRSVGTEAQFLEIKNNRLYVISGFNAKLSIYSLADPSNPALLGETPTMPYNAADSMVVTDTHVYVSATQFVFFFADGDIFDHNGALLSIDVSNPAAPFLDGVLFNDNGTNNDGIKVIGGVDQFGGNRNVWSVKQVTPTLLYLAGSTVTGTNTNAGTGIISVIDISDPLNLQVVREMTIPGTVQSLGLSIEGNRAFVTSSTGGWKDFTFVNEFGLTGDVAIATLDISNPADPQFLHGETLDRASKGMSANNHSLGAGVYSFSSLGVDGDQPALYLTDVSDPNVPLVTSLNVPTEIRRQFALGNFIYTVSPSGLIIYQVDPIEAIVTTAKVEIPKGNGVAPIPGSFSTTPTQIIPGADFDTYVFDVKLISGIASRVITWDSQVTNIKPGETRNATLNTYVEYDYLSGPTQIVLPPQEVVGKQILTLSPNSYTVAPGQPAFFLALIDNPTLEDREFTISIDGVPQEWVQQVSSVFVFGRGTGFVGFSIQADPFAPLATYAFTVTATSDQIVGAVGGDVTLVGDPSLPEAQGDSHALVSELLPNSATIGQGGSKTFVVRLINAGNAVDIINLSAFDIPPGFTGKFSEDFIELAPGASNYRDIYFTLTAPQNVEPGSYNFTVVTNTNYGGTLNRVDLAGAINVLNLGVSAQFQAASGPPNNVYPLLVKNTGLVTETFDLTLSGPGGIVSTLGQTSVTLAPGASQLVNVTVGEIDFAFTGEVLLQATAKSRTNGAVLSVDDLRLTIESRLGMDAAFDKDKITPPTPGAYSTLFVIDNLGNFEDEYVVEITSVTGPVTASLVGLHGAPTQSIPIMRVPGLAQGAIEVKALINALASGSIRVRVRSLTDDSIVAEDTLEIVGGPSSQPPVITNSNSAETVQLSRAENSTAVVDIDATDADTPAAQLVYSISGGADASFFSIDARTGVLRFKTAPDFETPLDQNKDNVYQVIVRVSDGLSFDSQTQLVTVTNVNEAPRFTSGGGGDSVKITIAENLVVTYDANSEDPDLPAQTRTYFISGGPDAERFVIDKNTGVLRFKNPRDFENPVDIGCDNVYDVIIRVTDGSLFDTQSISVRVVNGNEFPTITSNGGLDSVSLSIRENTRMVADANSSDPDVPAQTRTYSIAGGPDAALFTIDAGSGILQFIIAPDFENPRDSGANNVYNVTIQVSDGQLSDSQAFTITVTNQASEGTQWVAVGADASATGQPLVKIFRPDGTLLEQFLAYEANYRGGVRVVTADVTGDGVMDVITAPGRGHAPIIKVFDGATMVDGVIGNAKELPAFVIDAYPAGFADGLFIAVGDVVGDGLLDIVAIPERGTSEVRVFRNRLNDTPHPHPGDAFSNTPWRSFTVFDANYLGGGTIAVGEVDKSRGKSEVIVGSGAGMRATVKAFNVNGASPVLVNTYYPIDDNFRGGVFVAAGDINGDGVADIIAGAGKGGSSKVSILDGKNGKSLGAFYPYADSSKQAAVRVSVKDLNGDGVIDAIFAGHDTDGKTKMVRRYSPSSKLLADFVFENDLAIGGGYFLG